MTTSFEVHGTPLSVAMWRATVATALSLIAACTSPQQDNSTAALTTRAAQPVTCDDISDTCANHFIDRSSACAQLANTGTQQADDASRQCAESNYEAALAHAPANSGDSTRTKALIGLADALKQIRDNSHVQNDRVAAQQKLDAATNALSQQQDGHAYAQYFHADTLVAQARSPGVSAADACARLHDARSSLPATGSDDQLTIRVNRLGNAINLYTQQGNCQ